MKISISYPPLPSAKGVPLLGQNRQFQYFHSPTYIYPVVPAYAATLLRNAGYEVIWDDGIAEEKFYSRWLIDLEKSDPDVIMIETKTPVSS
jgi:anaerobic magnesium-protoporphyrin IX monomethyl ester cyclase